jgi:hypothetical protein
MPPAHPATRDAARAARKALDRGPPRRLSPDERFARWLGREGRRERPASPIRLPCQKERWTAAEDAWLRARLDQPVPDVALVLGRSPMAVYRRRSAMRR